MFYQLASKLDSQNAIETVDAHCDIPCKIYDPSAAQIAALTILRMVDLIHQTEKNSVDKDANYFNSMARFVATKEQHGLQCKQEICVIWGDYFKQPQFEKFPEIHILTHDIMMLASQAKQSADREKALELIKQVNRFAEIFWATKDVKTKTAVCPYPPAVDVIYPDL